ncbi:hypothetical protein LTR49_021042 [Elasticomyces elasticus]|nr:hypothetical protein LTR49_021042 [Elasticomyces elasticus]
MARLNEPPALAPASIVALQPGAESVDAVKRRFIRQNRELAKNNSTQSLRIRSLEIDVTRLQADNLNLRERVLQLQNEVEAARCGQVAGDAVRKVREELQAKLMELSELVDGIDALAHVPDDTAVKTGWDRQPLDGQWRERQPLTEAMRENQMPTISEDKSYPRRTLNADEIQSIRLSNHSSNESPDLGPPPVARFDYEDPVKQLSLSAIPPPLELAEDDELPATLSVNLETRPRKRKDSQPKLEIRRHSIVSQSPTKTDAEPLTILRTGAKRKLGDRDLDKPIKPPAQGDFTFSRKSAGSEAKIAAQQAAASAAKAPEEQVSELAKDVSATPPKPVRRVLGDKSVNMSPKKVLAPALLDKPGKDLPEKSTKPAGPRSSSAASRKRRVSAIPQPLVHEDVVPTVEIAAPAEHVEIPPETPAPADFFSPTPSEASAARPIDGSIRAGTPPPSDLSTMSIATDGGGMRPLRRARTAVNYTEPSLNAKIRRPGKGMVDAVTGLVDPRRAMSVSERKPSLQRTVVVKKEPVDDEGIVERWLDLPPADTSALPGSPLAPKHVEVESDRPLQQVVDEVVPQQGEHPSAASATISALMAGGRRRRREPVQHLPQDDPSSDVAAKMEDLDIYDFRDSSSPADGQDVASRSTKPAGSHRRHSSVPKALTDTLAPESKSAASALRPGDNGRTERAASRRRSMMI